ncbi:type II toxin-antitoxin system HicA family toxin [Microseira sp. BLCC-F43]|jgi:predicted RNA binding protein YcfA (HicA-like mRNA interferase family)|uniref:type II toxin-antitoxin system HicA family toxin n=1 Tax=Microseira sp. BLCC-F43 TaxID=3153602 RepID=UPI0035B9F62F
MRKFLKSDLDCISGVAALSSLKRLGFVEVGKEGNHVLLTKWTSQREVRCVVPLHPKLVSKTLRCIVELQAKVSWEEFRERLEA